MKKNGVMAILSLLLGCGGAAKQYESAAYGSAPPPPPAPEAAPAEPSLPGSSASVRYDYDQKEESDYGRAYSVEDEALKDGVARPAKSDMKKSAPESVRPSGNVSGGSGSDTGSTVSTPPTDAKVVSTQDEPMIIYSGYLQLRVKRLLDAVDQITALVEKRGGYIDSLTSTAVVVRIPGKDFDAAMQELAALGDLLDRWVRAEDVTEQFTDLGARLQVAEEARERLLKLLEKVENVSERLRILQEIKRLSEQIDTIESSLAAIRNLVDFFTITIDLVPILETERVDTGLSPFAWIRGLKPHVQSLYKGKHAVSMTLPKGFVLFDEEDNFLAQSADTSVIRAAVVKNEPMGDNRFWIDAVDFEMTTRQEKIVEKGDTGKLTYRLYENDDVTPRFYLVALYTAEDKIYVIEVFYPNADAKERHHKAVVEALKTVEVK